MDASVRVTAPAKINLFLGVGALRADGYHGVTTVMHALELHDEITIRPASALSVACAPDVGVPAEKNLAWRAATALARVLGRSPDVDIRIVKRIPHGAGLGGGSSDAAAVLAGLASMWGVDPLDPRCLGVAAELGADVPFFLLGGAALLKGRGDVFDKHLPAADVPVAIAKPADSAPTADVYRAFDRYPVTAGDPEKVIAALKAHDPARLGASVENNMTAAACEVVPAVCDIHAMMSAVDGVTGCAVAGSGSAVFALCSDEEVAAGVVDAAASKGWWSVSTRLSPAGVEVAEGEHA